MIANKAREQGVDTSHIVWTKEGRAGLYFVEFGSTPRPTRVIYDRKDSAASTLGPGEIDWEKIFKDTKLFHTTGITLALSKSCEEATIAAIQAAKKVNCKMCFDLNYRAKLWSAIEAKICFEKILNKVDILITTQFDAEEVLGYTGNYEDIAKKLSDDFSIPVVAITLRGVKTVRTGTWTSLVYADGRLHTDNVSEIEVVDRFGVGDSFTAGFIYGYLTEGVERGLKIGDGMAALKHSITGDINWVTMEDLQEFLKSKSFRVQR
jgi:2-dehydro-3-deoxygluconokinase